MALLLFLKHGNWLSHMVETNNLSLQCSLGKREVKVISDLSHLHSTGYQGWWVDHTLELGR